MIILHSQSFPHFGLERFFEFTKSAGFDGVEIMITENYDTQNPGYIKRLEERYELPVLAFSIQPGKEEKLHEAFQHTVREFPGRTMNLLPASNLSFGYKKWMKNIAPKLAEKYNLQFNRRNAPFGTILGFLPKQSENSITALKEAGDVCLDLSALWESKDEVMRTIQFLGDHLKHIYLSNVHGNVPYNLLPKGVLPLESMLTKLAKAKFKWNFTFQVAPKFIHEENLDRMMEILKESREFYDTYFSKVLKETLDAEKNPLIAKAQEQADARAAEQIQEKDPTQEGGTPEDITPQAGPQAA